MIRESACAEAASNVLDYVMPYNKELQRFVSEIQKIFVGESNFRMGRTLSSHLSDLYRTNLSSSVSRHNLDYAGPPLGKRAGWGHFTTSNKLQDVPTVPNDYQAIVSNRNMEIYQLPF